MIPLFDLSSQYKQLKNEIDKTIKETLFSGSYILGKKVREFENKFAHYLGTKFCVGVASGTDALKISIKALGLNESDEVIVPANVYPTAFGVLESRVRIKLVDVDKSNYNLDPNKLRKIITKRTKAVVFVHLYGNPTGVESVIKTCRENNLAIIEDCAQSHGAKIQNKMVGTFGDVSSFSFYPTKPLGAFGDGGLISTDNQKTYEKVLQLRMYGEEKRYSSQGFGYNSRLDELQAAILLIKLRYLNHWNQERNKIAAIYINGLKKVKQIKIKTIPKNTYSVYHLFVVEVENRQNLIQFLQSEKIMSGIHYPKPIHMVKTFNYLGYKEGNFPISESLSSSILTLPCFPGLQESRVNFICKKINEFYEKKA